MTAGLGAAVITKEKVEERLGDFVKQGRMSAAEAREMAEKIAQEGRREFDKASAKVGEKARDLLSSLDGKCIERIEDLEARVAALEGKLPKSPRPRAKT